MICQSISRFILLIWRKLNRNMLQKGKGIEGREIHGWCDCAFWLCTSTAILDNLGISHFETSLFFFLFWLSHVCIYITFILSFFYKNREVGVTPYRFVGEYSIIMPHNRLCPLMTPLKRSKFHKPNPNPT